MRVLILGATGRTGKWVLKFALKERYDVNILVRNTSSITEHENLNVYKGNPANFEDLVRASVGCNAVLSVLNISRTSDFPWSKLRTPKTFLSDVMQNVIALSKELNIKRVIVCSAWGVAETNMDIPFLFRWTIKYSNIAPAYLDHERQENLIMVSELDWTIVRPVGLINSRKLQRVKISYNNNPRPKLLISRRSVAEFMVDALMDDGLIDKTPVIYAD